MSASAQAEAMKETGNRMFREQKYEEAEAWYTKAIVRVGRMAAALGASLTRFWWGFRKRATPRC